MHCIIIFEKSGSTEFAVNLLCIETEILNISIYYMLHSLTCITARFLAL